MDKRPISKVVSPAAVALQHGFPVNEVFLALAGLVILLRITIWRFFLNSEVFFREDFSNVLIAFAIALLVSAWLVVKILRREAIRPSGFEIPIVLLLGAAIGSLFYTVNFSASQTGVLVLISQAAFFFMLQDVLDTRRRVLGFVCFLLCCAVLMAIYGIKDFIFLSWRPSLPTDIEIAKTNQSLYYVLTNRRVTSFLGWPNTLAGYLMLFMPLAAAFAVTAKQWWLKILSFSSFLTLVVCFVFTFSFLGWLSFLFATIILFLCSWRFLRVRDWPTGTKAALITTAVVFVILFGWVIVRKNFAGALAPRLEYYKSAVALVKARPFLGHGWDTYEVASRKFTTSQTGLTAFVHNSYLQTWVETGVVGLIGLVLLVGFFVGLSVSAIRRYGWGESQFVLLAVIWGLGAFFIDNLFSFTLLKPNIALHVWVMLAVFVALCREGKDGSEAALGRRGLSFLTPLMALVVLYYLCRMVMGFGSYQAGREAFLQGDLGRTERALFRAQEWDPWRAKFRSVLGDIYLKAYFQTGEVKYFDRAEAQYWQAINRSPLSYEYYFILSKLYERHGDKIKAEQLAREAKLLSPYQFERDIKLLEEMAGRKKINRGGDYD